MRDLRDFVRTSISKVPQRNSLRRMQLRGSCGTAVLLSCTLSIRRSDIYIGVGTPTNSPASPAVVVTPCGSMSYLCGTWSKETRRRPAVVPQRGGVA